MKDDRLTIIQGDCVEKLRELPEASIDLIVTSPPYGNLRTYGYAFKWDFKPLAHACFRVLKDRGVMCWNVGDEVKGGSETLEPFRQALYFRDVVGFLAHDTMIYEKTNFGHPESLRYHQLFEFIFVLSKGGPPKTWSPLKDKPNAWAGTGPFGVSTMRCANGEQKKKKRNIIADFGMRGNVWRCKTAGQENVCSPIQHPAVMPKTLAQDLILSWSNPGDLVADPFAGSFTTCAVALELARKTIGIELNPEYVEMGKRRCYEVTPGLPLK